MNQGKCVYLHMYRSVSGRTQKTPDNTRGLWEGGRGGWGGWGMVGETEP